MVTTKPLVTLDSTLAQLLSAKLDGLRMFIEPLNLNDLLLLDLEKLVKNLDVKIIAYFIYELN